MSTLAIGLIIVAATVTAGVAASWMRWVSLTLISILKGITANNERLDDHDRRLTDGGL